LDWVSRSYRTQDGPNARYELLPEAGARHERTLEAVSSRPMLGWVCPVEPRVRYCPPLDDNAMRMRPAAHATFLHCSQAPPYLMTSSAKTRRCGGIVIPRAWAVFRLMSRSNFVGRSTGRSAGLAPFRILST
jgi:hypothetical protein